MNNYTLVGVILYLVNVLSWLSDVISLGILLICKESVLFCYTVQVHSSACTCSDYFIFKVWELEVRNLIFCELIKICTVRMDRYNFLICVFCNFFCRCNLTCSVVYNKYNFLFFDAVLTTTSICDFYCAVVTFCFCFHFAVVAALGSIALVPIGC